MTKRILSMLLAIVMIVGIVPFDADAARIGSYEIDTKVYEEFIKTTTKNPSCEKSFLHLHWLFEKYL